MAYNFLPCDRDQGFLLPPDLREWLPADHLTWFVLDVVDPDSAAARPVTAELAAFSDARVERFWRLLAVINGWGEIASTRPAYEWAIAALRAPDSTG